MFGPARPLAARTAYGVKGHISLSCRTLSLSVYAEGPFSLKSVTLCAEESYGHARLAYDVQQGYADMA